MPKIKQETVNKRREALLKEAQIIFSAMLLMEIPLSEQMKDKIQTFLRKAE